MSRYCFILLTTLVLTVSACFRTEDEPLRKHAPFMLEDSAWADSMLLEMTLEEKIGQLVFLKTSLSEPGEKDSLLQMAWSGRVGGLLLQDQQVDSFIQIVDTVQMISRLPLFIGSEEKVSLCNQFSDLEDFPLPVSISSVGSKEYQDHLGELLVEQYKALGINFSFAPSINLLENRDSLFDFQSFDFDQEEAIHQSSIMLEKLQDRQILSVANSFNDLYYPETDTARVLDSLLHRYYNLTQNGVSGFKVGEKIFEIDSLSDLQTYFLKNYLQKEIEFSGLLVAEIDSTINLDQAIHTGADIFVVSNSVDSTIAYIKNFMALGLISKKTLNEKVHKVLLAKDWLGLNDPIERIEREEAWAKLDMDYFDYYRRNLFESSMILAHNHNSILPMDNIHKKRIRLIEVGKEKLKMFESYFKKYDQFSKYSIVPNDSTGLIPANSSKLKKAPLVFTIDNYNLDAKRDSAFIANTNALSKTTEVVLVNFGIPNNLLHFDTTMSMVQLFERNKLTEEFAAQLLFGGTTAKGKLPLYLADHLKEGQSNETKITRLKYTVPEEVGIASHKLVAIDAMAYNAILSKQMPGCQVLIAKEGKVIYSKSFGYHSYDRKRPVRNTDLYDLASVTKIAATTLAAMKLYEGNKFKMSDRLYKHLPLGDKSRIRNITFKQLFTHRSGLQSNMPIASFLNFRDSTNTLCNDYFCREKSFSYTIPVAGSMYMDYRWVDSLWQDVYSLKPYKSRRYRYSDVNFNLIQKMIETRAERSLDDYLDRTFYEPLNINRCLYKPLERFSEIDIIPTENDEKWRKQVLNGHVHDEAAALLGGVAGNAGLFATAEDLAVLFQMLLNEGHYGGQQFLKKETIKFFTASHGERGLGFDKKKNSAKHACCRLASSKTYGHTGFTGTSVWVDPEEELIFIFLANRIYPNIANRKLYQKGTRKRIHTIVYKALDTFKYDEVFEPFPADLYKAEIPTASNVDF